MSVEPENIETVSDHLRQQDGLDHLRVRKWGKSLIIYSGDDSMRDNHARVTLISPKTWGLSFAHHTGRWERTPFVGRLDEVLKMLTSNFRPFLE